VQSEKAILDAMRWLVRHQEADGSWRAKGLAARCQSEPACTSNHDAGACGDVGVTSLALLCFLGAGFHHESRQDLVDLVASRRSTIGPLVHKGVSWLIERQADDGSWPQSDNGLENHTLATLVLVEDFALTGAVGLREPAQKAVDALQRAQLPNPSGESRWGWSRRNTEHSPAGETDSADITATAWAMQALHAAGLAGLTVEADTIPGAMAYSDHLWKTISSSKAADPRTTALACVRILGRPSPADPVLKRAVDQILERLATGGAADPMTAFQESFVVSQVHGFASAIRNLDVWKRWTQTAPPALMAAQDKTEKTCRHGGWLSPTNSSASAGPAASTALGALSLENFYRYGSLFAKAK
jgi:hypothetical protein